MVSRVVHGLRDALAEALFDYRTSSDMPLPPDWFARQSEVMQQPVWDEADAILAHPAMVAAIRSTDVPVAEGLTDEAVARLFHETYERLAPQFGYETRRESAVPWEDVPEANRRLMVAVAGEVLAALRATDVPSDGLREALCAHMEPHDAHDEPNPWRGLSDPFRCPGRAAHSDPAT